MVLNPEDHPNKSHRKYDTCECGGPKTVVSELCIHCRRGDRHASWRGGDKFKYHREKLKSPPCGDCGGPTSPSNKSGKCFKCYHAWRTGANHHTWKGGTRNSQGYKLIRDPHHPRAHTSGYVLEHIVIMEEFLGRALFPDENVHHKNGQRDDNRIENLELWSTSQPPGQRVEDKLRWAREILDRYEEI